MLPIHYHQIYACQILEPWAHGAYPMKSSCGSFGKRKECGQIMRMKSRLGDGPNESAHPPESPIL